MKKILLFIIFIFNGAAVLSAQSSVLPNEGKMLTTVLVLVAILVGLFSFLFYLGSKLNKLENLINNES